MPNRFEVRFQEDELNLPLCLNSGQAFRWGMRADGSWLGASGSHWYRIWPREGGAAVESNGEEGDFSNLFRLDWDATAVRRDVLRMGPEVKPYLDAMPGLRVLRQSDPNEVFFTFMCSANNHIPRIRSMVQHLASLGPLLAEVEGVRLFRFPDLETLARVGEPALRAAGFGYRAATIPAAARQMLDKAPDWLAGLKNRPYAEAHAELVSIKGIGPKLADCVALFGLDHPEAVPIDTHMWQALTRLYFPEWKDAAVTARRYQTAADKLRERFGKHAGWVHQFLFYDNVLNWRARDK